MFAGEVPEWPNGTAWKAVRVYPPVGSNPTLSANLIKSTLERVFLLNLAGWDSKGGGAKRRARAGSA